MKRLITLLMLIGSTALALSPQANTANVTINSKTGGRYDQFYWNIGSYNDQSCSINYNESLAGADCYFKMSQVMTTGQVTYLYITNITVSTTNTTWSIARTNLNMPLGIYLAEVYADDPNDSALSVARGKINVTRSLFLTDDDVIGTPAITNLTSYVRKDGDFDQFTGLIGTNGQIWVSDGSGGGNWTDNMSPNISGGTNILVVISGTNVTVHTDGALQTSIDANSATGAVNTANITLNSVTGALQQIQIDANTSTGGINTAAITANDTDISNLASTQQTVKATADGALQTDGSNPMDLGVEFIVDDLIVSTTGVRVVDNASGVGDTQIITNGHIWAGLGSGSESLISVTKSKSAQGCSLHGYISGDPGFTFGSVQGAQFRGRVGILGSGKISIGQEANGASIYGTVPDGLYHEIHIEPYAAGAFMRIGSDATVLHTIKARIESYAYGAGILGYISDGGTVTNWGKGSLALVDLGNNENCYIANGAEESMALGAVTITHKQSLVAGDGRASKGNGSIVGNQIDGTAVTENSTNILAAAVAAQANANALNSRTNDWNMRVESIVVQDPTNNLAAPYWVNVPTNATLHRVMAQSWGCTGIVDVVKKGWLEPMNDYDNLQTDIAAQLTATVLESGSLTNQTLVHTNNLGVVFSEIDNFSITNRMDVYLWYTIP